jgi:uncharacterized membrane protein YfcA
VTLTITDIVFLCGIGVCAGTLGGLMGIGGSVIMLPAMALLFAGRGWAEQHLFQAAAMIVNVAIAIPSARQHLRKGAFRMGLFKKVMPATLVAIVAGVLVSDLLPGHRLQQILAVFLAYVSVQMVVKATRNTPEFTPEQEKATTLRLFAVGGVMGFAAGLLGIGGGVIATPLAAALCKVPIRNGIALSAMTMCVTSPVGAALKVARIEQHGHAIVDPLVIALCLIPCAILGSHLGAKLTHVLPLRGLRIVFGVVLAVVAFRLWSAASNAAAEAESPAAAASSLPAVSPHAGAGVDAAQQTDARKEQPADTDPTERTESVDSTQRGR